MYNASAAPAPTKYAVQDGKDVGANAGATSELVAPMESGYTDRFAGPTSVYNASAAPAPTKYQPKNMHASTAASSLTVAPMESGYTDRFAGPTSLYRKGLRASTIPEARDPSSFPAKKTIGKPASVSRGAALKARLKALGTVAETIEESKENAVALE